MRRPLGPRHVGAPPACTSHLLTGCRWGSRRPRPALPLAKQARERGAGAVGRAGGRARAGRAAGVPGHNLQHGARVADAQVERLAPDRARLGALCARARGLPAGRGATRPAAGPHGQAQVRVHRARRAPHPRGALRQLRLQHLRRARRAGRSQGCHPTLCLCQQRAHACERARRAARAARAAQAPLTLERHLQRGRCARAHLRAGEQPHSVCRRSSPPSSAGGVRDGAG